MAARFVGGRNVRLLLRGAEEGNVHRELACLQYKYTIRPHFAQIGLIEKAHTLLISFHAVCLSQVYGHTPFSHLRNIYQKLQAIPDPSKPIEYAP